MPQDLSRRRLRLVAASFLSAAGLVLILSVQASLAGGRVAPATVTECRDDARVHEPHASHPAECGTHAPTVAPTVAPTGTPTVPPTLAPTAAPTQRPTEVPTETPTAAPTATPTQAPTQAPTQQPTLAPSSAPTAALTVAPTTAPRAARTRVPRRFATSAPTLAQTQAPTPATTAVPPQAVEAATSGPGGGQGGATSPGGGPGPGGEPGLHSALSADGLIATIAAGLLDGNPSSGQGSAGLAGLLASAALLASLGAAVWAERTRNPSRPLAPASAAGSASVAGAAATVGAAGETFDPMARGSSATQGAVAVVAGVTGAGSAAAGALSAAGAVFGAGFNLPLPRPDLVQGGLGMFRSMKRVTEEADPSGYSAGDMAQFVGDAAGLAALASVLAPAVGALSLATSGAAAASDVKSPHEIIEGLRQNFARIGYMQGIVDANLNREDGKLGAFVRPRSAPLPTSPPDPTSMDDATLRAAGAEWAKLADAALGDVVTDDALLAYLQSKQVQLDFQSDILCDLLDRSETTEVVPLNEEAIAALAFGRGWYSGSDSARMADELRRGFERSKADASSAGSVGSTVGQESPKTLDDWAAAVGARNSCLGVLEATAGVERWRGFCDALVGSVGDRLAAARAQASQTAAVHRDLGVEIERRGGKEA